MAAFSEKNFARNDWHMRSENILDIARKIPLRHGLVGSTHSKMKGCGPIQKI